MVQILPPKTNIGAEIGRSLGEGLGGGIAKGSEIGFQRGLLQDAFTKAGNLYKDPNVSPIDRTLGALTAFAGVPGSERWADKVLPMLNQMAAFNEQTQPNNADQNQSSQNGNAKRIIGGQAVPNPTEAAFAQEDVDLYEPFLGQGAKKFSPQEIQAIEERDLSRGLPNSPRAEFMRKQNKEIEDAVDTISKRQRDFSNYYRESHPNQSEDDNRIAQRFYRTKEALKAPTNEEKSRIVDNYVQRYNALKRNITEQTPRNIIGKVRKDQFKELRNQGEWLIKEGQRDLFKQLLTKDLQLGDAESEYVIKEPTASQEKLLTDFPRLPGLDVSVPTFGKDSARLFQTKTPERTKQLEKYENRLQDAIKPGTAKEPGTSLLVLRDLARQTGMTWVEFNDVVNDLIKKGKVKLDPYQSQELPKLTRPPHAGFFDMLIDRK